MNIVSHIALLMVFALLAGGGVAFGMEDLSDGDLAHCEGAAGISILPVDVSILWRAERLIYTDSDTGETLELQGISLSNGLGGAFSLGGEQPITFDVLTVDDPESPINGKSLIQIAAPSWKQNAHLSVEQIVFAGQDLGRFDLGKIDLSSFHLLLAGQGTGIEFEFGFQSRLEEIDYAYNTSSESLQFTGVRFAETVNGDPALPDSWTSSGRFRFGNMYGADPASLNVAASEPIPGQKQVSLVFNLPAQGAIRIEEVAFGPENFGPVALDGITIHRMKLELRPGG